jgi:hypothetical protein
MFAFFVGLIFGASFGFLIGAMMTLAKCADDRIEREKEDAADRNMMRVEHETQVQRKTPEKPIGRKEPA